jgi:predicted  nucleic acid-binding Zn-ribbon protein
MATAITTRQVGLIGEGEDFPLAGLTQADIDRLVNLGAIVLDESDETTSKPLPENVKKLQAELKAATAQIAGLEAEKAALEGEVKTLADHITALQVEIATLQDPAPQGTGEAPAPTDPA